MTRAREGKEWLPHLRDREAPAEVMAVSCRHEDATMRYWVLRVLRGAHAPAATQKQGTIPAKAGEKTARAVLGSQE